MINNLFESAEKCSVSLTSSQNQIITECINTLSELDDNNIKHVLREAGLSPSDAVRIFKTAVAMRSEKGLVTKAKDAYVNSAEKIGKISKQVRSKLSDLVAASEPTTQKIINAIKQGGPKATQTIDIIDTKLDAQVLKAKNSARGYLTKSYSAVAKEIDEIEKIAKRSPQYGAFAVASLSSAEKMIRSQITDPSILLYLSTVSEVMKGKKLSSALEKAMGDIGPAGTASVKESDFEDIGRIRELAGLDTVNEKFGFGKKPELDYDELLVAWDRKGRPTDVDEIKKILASAGLSNREINKAFKKADVDDGEGSDFAVTRFSDAIKKADLSQYIIDYLEDMHPKDISESVQIDEAEVSDAQIKKVLLQVSRVYGAKDPSQTNAVKRYLKKFSNEFTAESDMDAKERIAGEAVNFLHDRQSYEEYEDAALAVTKLIRNSDLESNVKKNILDAIANKKIYKRRQTVKPEAAPKEKPRARVSSQGSGKPRVQMQNKKVESMTLTDLQKLFEDVIIRNMEFRYGRRKRETL